MKKKISLKEFNKIVENKDRKKSWSLCIGFWAIFIKSRISIKYIYMKNNKIGGNLFDLKILGRLFIFCKPFINTFYLLVFLTLLLSILGPIRPYLTQIIIDDYVVLNDLEGLKGMIFSSFFLTDN